MRKLTIKRNKAYPACLAKDKIYIEDHENSDITINGVPCRKIGILKNGEEKTFEIGFAPTRVYVISDKLSRNTANDFYKVPLGEEDITLTGEHKYNPFSGNTFRFDGVTDEEILAHRKKLSRKSAIFYIIFAVLVFAGTLALNIWLETEVEPVTFNYSEMSITLTSEFSERNVEGYSACYESYENVILIIKDDREYFENFDTYTLKEYAQDTITYNEFDSSVKLKEEMGLTYFEYDFTDEETGDAYSYFVPMYKSSDAFWFFQFASFEEDYETYREQFIEWAKTVEFTE